MVCCVLHATRHGNEGSDALLRSQPPVPQGTLLPRGAPAPVAPNACRAYHERPRVVDDGHARPIAPIRGHRHICQPAAAVSSWRRPPPTAFGTPAHASLGLLPFATPPSAQRTSEDRPKWTKDLLDLVETAKTAHEKRKAHLKAATAANVARAAHADPTSTAHVTASQNIGLTVKLDECKTALGRAIQDLERTIERLVDPKGYQNIGNYLKAFMTTSLEKVKIKCEKIPDEREFDVTINQFVSSMRSSMKSARNASELEQSLVCMAFDVLSPRCAAVNCQALLERFVTADSPTPKPSDFVDTQLSMLHQLCYSHEVSQLADPAYQVFMAAVVCVIDVVVRQSVKRYLVEEGAKTTLSTSVAVCGFSGPCTPQDMIMSMLHCRHPDKSFTISEEKKQADDVHLKYIVTNTATIVHFSPGVAVQTKNRDTIILFPEFLMSQGAIGYNSSDVEDVYVNTSTHALSTQGRLTPRTTSFRVVPDYEQIFHVDEELYACTPTAMQSMINREKGVVPDGEVIFDVDEWCACTPTDDATMQSMTDREKGVRAISLCMFADTGALKPKQSCSPFLHSVVMKASGKTQFDFSDDANAMNKLNPEVVAELKRTKGAGVLDVSMSLTDDIGRFVYNICTEHNDDTDANHQMWSEILKSNSGLNGGLLTILVDDRDLPSLKLGVSRAPHRLTR